MSECECMFVCHKQLLLRELKLQIQTEKGCQSIIIHTELIMTHFCKILMFGNPYSTRHEDEPFGWALLKRDYRLQTAKFLNPLQRKLSAMFAFGQLYLLNKFTKFIEFTTGV